MKGKIKMARDGFDLLSTVLLETWRRQCDDQNWPFEADVADEMTTFVIDIISDYMFNKYAGEYDVLELAIQDAFTSREERTGSESWFSKIAKKFEPLNDNQKYTLTVSFDDPYRMRLAKAAIQFIENTRIDPEDITPMNDVILYEIANSIYHNFRPIHGEVRPPILPGMLDVQQRLGRWHWVSFYLRTAADSLAYFLETAPEESKRQLYEDAP